VLFGKIQGTKGPRPDAPERTLREPLLEVRSRGEDFPTHQIDPDTDGHLLVPVPTPLASFYVLDPDDSDVRTLVLVPSSAVLAFYVVSPASVGYDAAWWTDLWNRWFRSGSTPLRFYDGDDIWLAGYFIDASATIPSYRDVSPSARPARVLTQPPVYCDSDSPQTPEAVSGCAIARGTPAELLPRVWRYYLADPGWFVFTSVVAIPLILSAYFIRQAMLA
jgi:hypothetical protein